MDFTIKKHGCDQWTTEVVAPPFIAMVRVAVAWQGVAQYVWRLKLATPTLRNWVVHSALGYPWSTARSTCLYVCLYACMMYECVWYVCMSACMYVCVFVCMICIHIHIEFHIYIYIHMADCLKDRVPPFDSTDWSSTFLLQIASLVRFDTKSSFLGIGRPNKLVHFAWKL